MWELKDFLKTEMKLTSVKKLLNVILDTARCDESKIDSLEKISYVENTYKIICSE